MLSKMNELYTTQPDYHIDSGLWGEQPYLIQRVQEETSLFPDNHAQQLTAGRGFSSKILDHSYKVDGSGMNGDSGGEDLVRRLCQYLYSPNITRTDSPAQEKSTWKSDV